MNMIEKMARVLAVKFSGIEDDWQDWTDEVKAMLECLKEPTAEMVSAGAFGFFGEGSTELASGVWMDMVNAALEGK